jgi:hypothetical protein
VPRAWAPRLSLKLPPGLTPFARAVLGGFSPEVVAQAETQAFREALLQRERDQINLYRFRFPGSDVVAVSPLPDTMPPVLEDTSFSGRLGNLLGDRLGVHMVANFVSKLERSRNERCVASQFLAFASQCAAGFQPTFDLQFSVQTSGTVADRLHINVNYDSEREFDASNNINVYFQGKTHEFIDRLEFGNITLQLPPMQLITNSIPAGNFGFQATGQLGPLRYRGIAAQQKGNIPKTYEVVVGERTVRPDTRELEDYQFQARRFFFTVDPALFGAQYPNLDLLNNTQMRALATSLPENVRPSRLFVYKTVLNGQPPNPNGPQFQIIGDPNSQRGQIYQLLVENRDYYTDQSLLWIALPQQLNLESERLVIAYTLKIDGRDTVIAEVGGTPDLGFVAGRPQLAHLLWDPNVRPGDPAFRREIRSFYQIAGEDLRRASVNLRILTGVGEGQEKPVAGTADTYLQMFGLSQSGSASLFDVDNRIWPRPSDPNIAPSTGGTTQTKIIRDYFLVFPSVRPFGSDGLVQPGNPVSDTIYVTPNEDLYSAQHPPSRYRLSMRYDIEGGSNVGTIQLAAVQLRRGSEIVLIDGIQIARDTSYTIDYELGTITFMRPDTLFPPARPRRVSVRYEENPLFAAAPTSILAFSGSVPVERGEFGLTVISQNQATTFTRPPLGLEPQSSLIAGVNGRFNFEVAGLSRLIEKLPTIESTTLSHADLAVEFATSRPQPNKAKQAYVETFEGDGGLGLPLQEGAWYYSSQPALGLRLPQRLGSETFSLNRATTMAWQNAGVNLNNVPIQFQPSDIDPQLAFTRTGITAPETILWLTLYPLNIGGLFNDAKNDFQWKIQDALPGRRFRSIRTSLGAAGSDLSRVEYLQFWTLVDTSTAGRAANASIVIDLGDISENSISIGPTTLNLTTANGVTDSLYSGKALMGFDVLDSERDPLTRSFNQELNDNGLPGDVVSFLNVIRDGELETTLENYATCLRGAFRLLLLGDARTNCTVQNGRLDEEDLDGDNNLNLLDAQRESERVRRYIVDLSNPASYTRVGGCTVSAIDTVASGSGRQCWVQVRLPFGSPDDSTGGGPNVRRIRAARITVVSGPGAADTAFTYVPIAQFKFQGSALVKRSQATVRGVAGDTPAQGFTIATVIGTQDRDTLHNVDYESPPGVTDEAERTETGLENIQTVINEKSLRLLAGRLEQYERAEAFLRFPEGARNFMNYRELRVWARGRGNGWGQDGDLQFFIKIGRDAHNFYFYRTPINSGPGRAAWLPEVVVDFDKLFALRLQMQNDVFRESPDSITCTGVDSALIARSGLPVGQPLNRHAACADGYMVYSVDPITSPPSLSQVQELAVGMIRVGNGGGATLISPADTLELWVDDVRLTDVENTPGYAGQMNFSVQAGDVATFRMNANMKDAHFRQLTEQPTFLANDGVDFASAVRLEKHIPGASSYSIPLTIGYSRGGSEPLFLSQTDIPAQGIIGLRTPRSEVSRYSVALRRERELRNSAWGVLLNNIYATASLSRANSQSEFTEGGSNIWNAAVDYTIQTNPRELTLPGWLRFGSDQPALFRWNPTSFRVSTEVGKLSDRRRSFRSPVEVGIDTGRAVTGINHVLRTQSSIAFRPLPPVTFSANFITTRDLRDYGDTSATSVIASLEREKLFGMDVGLERERQLNSSLAFEPSLIPYFRPRFSLQTTSFMQRDPQSRQLVRTGDSTGAFRLPRRLSNGQNMVVGAFFEPGRAFRSWFGEQSLAGHIAGRFDGVNAIYSRNLSSSYDAAPFSPDAGYMFGLGGRDDFLENDGYRSTIATAGDQFSVDGGLRLTSDLTIASRTLFTHTDNFTRRLDNTLAVIQGRQRQIPDLRLQWRDSLSWLKNIAFGDSLDRTRPFRWMRVLSTVDVITGIAVIRNETFAPSENESGTGAGDERITLTKNPFLQLSFNWNDNGALNTQFEYRKQQRVDSVPGSFTRSNTTDMGIQMSRSFRMPARWRMRSRLRASFGWSKSRSTSYISVVNSDEPSRLADNGTDRWDVSAASDLVANLSFRLQASKSVSFDNNYNRKFSQFFLTAQFTFVFQTGDQIR